jgi:transcriptional antiterminator Rof (Rho-off)
MWLKIVGILLILLAAETAVFKWYYESTQDRIGVLRENAAKLEVAVQISEDSVDLLRSDATKHAELNSTLQLELQSAERYGDELRDTLQRHKLTYLALKKPGLIQKRMQNATDKLWVDITADIDVDNGLQSDTEAGTKDNNSN